MFGGDEVSAAVLDIGSYQTKVGYAGEESPKSVFRTSIGVQRIPRKENYVGTETTVIEDNVEIEGASSIDKKESLSFDSSEAKYFIGTNDLFHRRDNMEILSPYQYGYMENFDLVEKICDYIFKTCLRVNPLECPILMTEPSNNTRPRREKLTELIFEKYQSPGLFLAKTGVLSCFANGKSTGLVVDCGGSMTTVTPVHEGYALRKGVISQSLAGNFLSERLLDEIKKKDNISINPHYTFTRKRTKAGEFEIKPRDYPNTSQSYHDFHVLSIVDDMKAALFKVPPRPVPKDEEENSSLPSTTADSSKDASSTSTSTSSFTSTTNTANHNNATSSASVSPAIYELPDGKIIDIGPASVSIPEYLFDPKPLNEAKLEYNFLPLHQMLSNSIEKCDVDVRNSIFQGLILSGGSTLLPGFSERLQADLAASDQQFFKGKIIAPSNIERRFSSWIGGSILSSLGTFHQMWMSKQEFEEHGRTLVDKKCP